MGGFVFRFFFKQGTPKRVRDQIWNDKPDVEFTDEDPAILRAKLRYLPVILVTAMYGSPEGKRFKQRFPVMKGPIG